MLYGKFTYTSNFDEDILVWHDVLLTQPRFHSVQWKWPIVTIFDSLSCPALLQTDWVIVGHDSESNPMDWADKQNAQFTYTKIVSKFLRIFGEW